MGLSGLDQGYAFAGRYRIVRCLASGGMGAVYEVLHVETERRRALKVMLPELVNNAELRERFQREARVTANVTSEFIIEIFDAGVDATTGMPFLVMELLDGEELGKLVERSGPMAARDVVVLLGQVATALDKTHAAGIVHRDLKPENLYLTRRDDGSPRIKILDFGISKVLKDGTAANVTKTLGTPLYMAPEQIAAEALSPATDLYALALIAYTLLVGVPYWQDEADKTDNVLAFAIQASTGPVESACQRAARRGVGLAPALDAWFRKATARDPRQRFARAGDLVRELRAALGLTAREPDAPVSAVAMTQRAVTTPAPSIPLEPWSASQITKQPRRSLGALAVGGAVVFVGAAAAAYWLKRAPANVATPPPAASAEAAAPPLRPDLPAATATSPAPLAVIAPVESTSASASASPSPRPSAAPATTTTRNSVRRNPPRPAAAAPPQPATPATSPPLKYTRD